MLAPSQFPRNRITVAAWMAEMDRQRGARIRALREQGSMGREEMAPKLGVSVKTLYNWEKGHEINPQNLRALAKFFDVTVDYIRGGELPTPDLLGVQEDIVVGKLDEILASIATIEAQMALLVPAVQASGKKAPAKARKSRTTG